jgi:hypothetical protein
MATLEKGKFRFPEQESKCNYSVVHPCHYTKENVPAPIIILITRFIITYSSTVYIYIFFFCMARQPYMGLGLLVSSRFHGHTHLRHTTVGRTPLDE